MKKLIVVSMFMMVFSLVSSGVVLADDHDKFASGTFTYLAEAEPPYLFVHEIDGMFKGTLIQGPNVNGVSVAICQCKVRTGKGNGNNGYVGAPGDDFTITLTNTGPVGGGIGTYELSNGTGKLTGIEGNGNWTFDYATLSGTYEGETEIDED